jgi:hypothetical protein
MEDPDDPTVIAENELLGAAASIDAAAKKLASLRPRRSVQVSPKLLACVSLGCWVQGLFGALFGECVSLWRLLPCILLTTGPRKICLIFLVGLLMQPGIKHIITVGAVLSSLGRVRQHFHKLHHLHPHSIKLSCLYFGPFFGRWGFSCLCTTLFVALCGYTLFDQFVFSMCSTVAQFGAGLCILL